MSEQIDPSPENPVLQAQLKLPTVFVQSALVEQLLVPRVHSSRSLHVVPSPSKPELHEHVKLPSMFAQEALESHEAVPSKHSSTSLHPVPTNFPSPSYPVGQVQTALPKTVGSGSVHVALV